jgi:predicted dehydrogenase
MSNVNRRAFLASAAMATAAEARLSGAEGDQLRVGFIGVGSRGTALLRNFLDAKLGAVVAVCDIKSEHAKRAATLITGTGQKEPALVEEWKKLLEMKDIQAVVSALPCDLHASCYLNVIAAGKDLYGEKPMCLTPEDCDRVVKAANRSKQIVQIGFRAGRTRGSSSR